MNDTGDRPMSNRKKSLKRQRKRQRFFLFLVSVLIVTSIFLILSVACLIVTLKFPSLDIFEKKYVFKIGAENAKTKKTLSYEKNAVVRDGEVFLNFSYLAEVCGFSVSGDNSQLRYLLRNSGRDVILVDPGESYVYLNDSKIRLSSAAFISSDEDLFLPCSFVNNYLDGVSVTRDQENERLFYVTYNSENSFSLTVSFPQKSDAVEYP